MISSDTNRGSRRRFRASDLLAPALFVSALSFAGAPALLRAEQPQPDPEFTCGPVLTAEQSKTQLEQLEKSYGRFGDLTADFVQRSYFMGLGESVVSRGRVRFKKPGMMDWDYQTPDRQRFIADGRTLWFYQPELNQVTLGSFASSFKSDLPVSFLLGVGELSKAFDVESACKGRDETAIFSLVPKTPDPNLEEFYLLIDTKRDIPIGARVVDVGGNETAITFEDISFENELDAKQFTFVIPRGVDIIDNREQKNGAS